MARELLWQILEMAELLKPVIACRKTKSHMEKGLAAMPELMKALYLIGEDGRYDLVDIEASDEKGEDVKISIKVW